MAAFASTLLLYRGAMHVLTPFAPTILGRRLRRGKEDPARLGERLGRSDRPRPPGPLVWMHGASLGEGLALLPLVERLRREGVAILLTTGTVTSARVLADRMPPGVIHQFAPLDLPRVLNGFLDHWRPDLVLVAESELWPNILIDVAHRNVPLALVNARMSARSFARWRRARGFIGALLDRVVLCLAQSEADAERYSVLGARRVEVTGNLKYDAEPPPADPAALADLHARIAGRPAWIAASTHPDEEAMILGAHRKAAQAHPGLLSIIAPRQAERGAPLLQSAAALGLRAALRSRGDPIGPETDIYVADTFGELGLFYRLAPLVFVGKSLAGGGGQNPIEPGKLRRAVLHGPLVANFEEVYAALDAAGGARAVPDSASLAAAVESLLGDQPGLETMAEAAATATAALAGATERIMQALRPMLPTVSQARRAP